MSVWSKLVSSVILRANLKPIGEPICLNFLLKIMQEVKPVSLSAFTLSYAKMYVQNDVSYDIGCVYHHFSGVE